MSSKSNVETMSQAEEKLHKWFEELMVMAEKTSKCDEDNILLAGAFMSAARVLYFNYMNPDDAKHIMEQNTFDFIELIKGLEELEYKDSLNAVLINELKLQIEDYEKLVTHKNLIISDQDSLVLLLEKIQELDENKPTIH